MIRLADEIFSSSFPTPDRPSSGPDGASIPSGRGAATFPVLIADNVAEFFFGESPREDWDFRRDFPDCTPRFSRGFVEMTRPQRIYSSIKGVNPSDHLPDCWGWYIEARSREEIAVLLSGAGQDADLERPYRNTLRKLASSGRIDVEAVEEVLLAPDPVVAARGLSGPERGYLAAATIARELAILKVAGAGGGEAGCLGWLLRAGLVVEDDGVIVGPNATVDMLLDRAGRVVPPPLFDILGSGPLPAEARAEYQKQIMSMLLPTLLTLSYVNRPGVEVRACEPPGQPVDRHRERDRGVELAYFTLDIDAVTAAARN